MTRSNTPAPIFRARLRSSPASPTGRSSSTAFPRPMAMTGWRIGYGAGPKELVAALNKLQSQMASCASSVSQAASVAALTGDQSFAKEWLEVYRERAEVATDLLNQIPGLSCRPADGAFYVYPCCSGGDRKADAGRENDRIRFGLRSLPARFRGRRFGRRDGLRPFTLFPDFGRHEHRTSSGKAAPGSRAPARP